MQPTLVAVRPFSSYAIGDVITSSDDIAKILASEHASCVVKVTPRQTEA